MRFHVDPAVDEGKQDGGQHEDRDKDPGREDLTSGHHKRIVRQLQTGRVALHGSVQLGQVFLMQLL